MSNRHSLQATSTSSSNYKLRAMEEAGLVHREVFAEVPPRVEYSLTPLGKSLQPVLDALRDWGTEYKRHLSSGAPMVE